jgi:hypothetical protein
MHGLVNLLGLVGDTPLFDSATWNAELTWMTVLDVTQNENVYKGRKNNTTRWSNYELIDRPDSNYFGLGVNFTPTWYQVSPGMDMFMPLSWSQGVSGNSAVTSGGNESAGTFGIGIGLDVRQKYRFDVKYVGVFGDYSTCPRSVGNPATCVNGAMDVPNGVAAAISDRDFIAFTFKTTF